MDANAIAYVAPAITLMASEFAKGLMNDSGKAAWKQVCDLLGWAESPKPEVAYAEAEKAIQIRPESLGPITEILNSNDSTKGIVLYAKNVGAIHVHGDQHVTFN